MTSVGDISTAACLAQVLSSPTRLKLLKLVELEELCVCELSVMLGISQPAVSQHLVKLRQAGLVVERRVGPMVMCSAADVDGLVRSALLDVLARPAHELPEMATHLARLAEARQQLAAIAAAVPGTVSEEVG